MKKDPIPHRVSSDMLMEPHDLTVTLRRDLEATAIFEGLALPDWDAMPDVVHKKFHQQAIPGPLRESEKVSDLYLAAMRVAEQALMLAVDADRPKVFTVLEAHNGFCGWVAIRALVQLAGQDWDLGLGRTITGFGRKVGTAAINVNTAAEFARILGFSSYFPSEGRVVMGEHLTGLLFLDSDDCVHVQLAVYPDLAEPDTTFTLPDSIYQGGRVVPLTELAAEREAKLAQRAQAKARQAKAPAPAVIVAKPASVPCPTATGLVYVATWSEYRTRIQDFYLTVYSAARATETTEAGLELLSALKALGNSRKTIDFVKRQAKIAFDEMAVPGWENTISKKDVFSTCTFSNKDFHTVTAVRKVTQTVYEERAKTVKIEKVKSAEAAIQTDMTRAAGSGQLGGDPKPYSDPVENAIRQSTAAVHNGRAYTEPLVDMNRRDPEPTAPHNTHHDGRIYDVLPKGPLDPATVSLISQILRMPGGTQPLRKVLYDHAVTREPSGHPDARALADAMHGYVWNMVFGTLRHAAKDAVWRIVDVGGKRGTAEYVRSILKNTSFGWGHIDFISVHPAEDHYDALNAARWGDDVKPVTARNHTITFTRRIGYFQELQAEFADSGVKTLYVHNDTAYYYHEIVAGPNEWHFGSYNCYSTQSGTRKHLPRGQVTVTCLGDNRIAVHAYGNGQTYEHRSLKGWASESGENLSVLRLEADKGLHLEAFVVRPEMVATAEYFEVRAGGPNVDDTAVLAGVLASSNKPLDDAVLASMLPKVGPTAQQLTILNARRAHMVAPWRAQYQDAVANRSWFRRVRVICRANAALHAESSTYLAPQAASFAALCAADSIGYGALTLLGYVTGGQVEALSYAANFLRVRSKIACAISLTLFTVWGVVAAHRWFKTARLLSTEARRAPRATRQDEIMVAQLGADAGWWSRVKHFFARVWQSLAAAGSTLSSLRAYCARAATASAEALRASAAHRAAQATAAAAAAAVTATGHGAAQAATAVAAAARAARHADFAADLSDRAARQLARASGAAADFAATLRRRQRDHNCDVDYLLAVAAQRPDEPHDELVQCFGNKATGAWVAPAWVQVKLSSEREKARIKRITLPPPVVDTPLDPDRYYLSNPGTNHLDAVNSRSLRELTVYQPAFDWAASIVRPALERDTGAIRTGPVVRVGTRPVISYSVNHRNPRSVFSAFFARQLNPVVEPHPDTKRDLLEFIATAIPYETSRFDELGMPELEDYLAEKENWTAAKKNRYRQSWRMFKAYGTSRQEYDYGTRRPYIDCFVKSYEENTLIEGQPRARARNIGSLAQEWIFIQFLQTLLLRQHKLIHADFSYRATVDQYEAWMTQVNRDSRFQAAVSTDFSAFDSLQYDWLMEAVDRPVWEAACSRFAELYSWWTDAHSVVTLKAVATTGYELRYSHAGVRLFTAVASGTPSGHGPKTTDGGTRRNRMVQDYIAKHLPPAPYKRLITGDDFFLVAPQWYVDAYATTARRLYNSDNDASPHGLGWICKKILVQRRPLLFEFVSKVSASVGHTAILLRDPAKLLFNGRYYTGADRRLLGDPRLHRSAVLASDGVLCRGIPLLEDFDARTGPAAAAWIRQHTSVRGESSSALRVCCNPIPAFIGVTRLKTGRAPSTAEWVAALTSYDRPVVHLSDSFGHMVTGAAAPAAGLQITMPRSNSTKSTRQPRRKRSKPVTRRPAADKRPAPKPIVRADVQNATSAAEYLKCLIEPENYTSKIPNPVPLATHVCQAKGCVSVTTNADGYLVGWVNPHASTMITYANTGVITDSTALAGLTYSSVSPSPILGMGFKRRVVACVVNVEVLSPNMTRRGLLTGSFLIYQPSTLAGLSIDAIRDAPDSLTVNAAKQSSVRVLYKPFDPACSEFTADTLGVNSAFPSLFFSVSGAEANSTVMIKYRAVIEVVPAPSYADLLMPTLGPIGSPNDISRAAATVKHVMADAAPGVLKSITQHAVSALGGTAGLFMRGAALAIPYIASAAKAA